MSPKTPNGLKEIIPKNKDSLTNEEIEALVKELGVKNGDNTIYLEVIDEAGGVRKYHFPKLKEFPGKDGQVFKLREDIIKTKKELGLL